MDPALNNSRQAFVPIRRGDLMSMETRAQPDADRLALLCRLSQIFSSSLDLDAVLNRVIDETIGALHAERGFVMLREDGGRLSFRIARGMDRETIGSPQFQVSRGVVEQVAASGQPVLSLDAGTDDRFSMRRSVTDLRLRSLLCVPLKIQDQISGVIYLDNRQQAGMFDPDDLEFLSALASSAAIAIENARLYQVAVEKGRMERELQMARELQAGLLSAQPPPLAGWELATTWLPARETAGDYYDFVPLPGGALALVIADVCDKGMPAALFMALSRSLVRASLAGAPSLAEGIAQANRLIQADAASGMFVTLFCARLLPESGEIVYVNGGHNPPVLVPAADGQELAALRPTGMALGVLADAPYGQATVHLEPGDLLLLYTDGVTEATNGQGERFGQARLERLLRSVQPESPARVVAGLEAAVRDFTRPAALFDDVTVVAARRL
jgi:sigma-B regulation protein RsbU (phosphoserine phosphatase)